MSAAGKKSKKRSAASSKQPPKDYTIYLDRNLGRHLIAETLRASGLKVEVHDDHLPIDAPDEEWIALVGMRGWIGITKDKNIRYRFAEIDAIRKYKAMILVVRAKNVTGSDMAKLLAQSSRKIRNYFARHKVPHIAGIDRTGTISAYDL